jgi:hypothetical protein
VHLYGRYLPKEKTTLIKKTLEASGFSVEINQFPFPDDVTQSTILYSPFIQDEYAVNIASKELANLGYPINYSQSLFSGKHFYTKNNLGMFILPGGNTTEKLTIDIANLYKSTNCDHSVTLNLDAKGRYELTFKQLPFPEESDYLEGRWRITQYPYILLSLDNGYDWFYFQIRNEQSRDHIGPIQKTLLVSQDRYAHLYFCDFEYGLRF